MKTKAKAKRDRRTTASIYFRTLREIEMVRRAARVRDMTLNRFMSKAVVASASQVLSGVE